MNIWQNITLLRGWPILPIWLFLFLIYYLIYNVIIAFFKSEIVVLKRTTKRLPTWLNLNAVHTTNYKHHPLPLKRYVICGSCYTAKFHFDCYLTESFKISHTHTLYHPPKQQGAYAWPRNGKIHKHKQEMFTSPQRSCHRRWRRDPVAEASRLNHFN